MLKRTYRVVLEVEVEMGDISLDAALARRAERRRAWLREFGAQGDFPPPGIPVPAPADLRDQQMLMEALLNAHTPLDEWMRDAALTPLDDLELAEVQSSPQPERCLLPVVDTLPVRQRHRFREAIAKDTFFDVASEFFECIETRLRLVSFEQS